MDARESAAVRLGRPCRRHADDHLCPGARARAREVVRATHSRRVGGGAGGTVSRDEARRPELPVALRRQPLAGRAVPPDVQSPPALVSGGKPRTGRRLARRVWRARSEVGNSELSGMAGPGHPGQVQGDRPPWQLVRCQSAPSTTVPVDESTPPVPLHSAVRAFGTWRSPHSPRSWRVASTKVNIPYIPGWV